MLRRNVHEKDKHTENMLEGGVPKEVKRKNVIKVVRSILEGVVLLAIVILLIKTFVTYRRYVPYQEQPQVKVGDKDNGFIAIAYTGVGRNETDSLISTERLNKHLDALKASGYVTITQKDIVDYYQNGKKLPDKSLFLVFEDGRKDTAIFAEKIMEEENYLGTMMTYANKIATKDSKFLMPKDLKNLKDSTFWELGTNGYRFCYINEQNKYRTHYLMDYVRDDFGIPQESYLEMNERIVYDYKKMNEIYTKGVGSVPQMYSLMHSNTGQFGENENVSRINQEQIVSMFSLNFNRLGYSQNTRENSIYDLTRIQSQPDWPANHLLMKISHDTGDSQTWTDGDPEKKALWEDKRGRSEFTDQDVILTTGESGESNVFFKQEELPEDLMIEADFAGDRKTGSQYIWLRADQKFKNSIEVGIEDNKLIVREREKRVLTELFSKDLDNSEACSVRISLIGNKLNVYVDEELLAKDVEVSISEKGTVVLQAIRGDVDIYDGVFRNLVIGENGGSKMGSIIYEGRLGGLEEVRNHLVLMGEAIINWFIQTF